MDEGSGSLTVVAVVWLLSYTAAVEVLHHTVPDRQQSVACWCSLGLAGKHQMGDSRVCALQSRHGLGFDSAAVVPALAKAWLPMTDMLWSVNTVPSCSGAGLV
jgi:hypothetical protein